MSICSNKQNLKIDTFIYTAGLWTAYPFEYQDVDPEVGLSCQAVNISILCTADEWKTLWGVYDKWLPERVGDDVVTFPSGSTRSLNIREYLGSNVLVDLSVMGVQWDNVKCYFLEAPQVQQFGDYFQATVKLVDAEAWINLKFRRDEIALHESFNYFDEFDLWGTVLFLRKDPDSYQDVPTLSLSAGGVSYTTGPRTPTQIMNIEGDTTIEGWNAIYEQYKVIASAPPEAGTWFPVTAPTATVSKRMTLSKGRPERVDIYTVSMVLAMPQIA